MSEENVKRLGIVASIITIIGAIWYFLKGSYAPVLSTSVTPGGAVQPAGDPVLFNVPGTAGIAAAQPGTQPGPAGPAGTPGANGAPGTAYSLDGGSAYPGASPWLGVPATLLPDEIPQTLTYNLSPSADLNKMMASIAAPADLTPGGCGCTKPACTSKAIPAQFPDGSGSCLSSTRGNLVSAIQACKPAAFFNSVENMQSNFRYASILGGTFDVSTFGALLAEPNFDVPVTMWGS